MHGGEVFKYGVTSIVQEVRKLAADAGITPQDIDHFVFHQPMGAFSIRLSRDWA